MYTLKNVLSTYFDSLSELREQVASQLGSKVVSQRPEFAIGYFSGQTKVWINDESDLKLVWQLIQKSSNTMLWCDGYQERHLKRVRQSSPMISSDSDDDLGAHKISVGYNPKSKKPKKSLKSAAIEEKQERPIK